MDLKRRNKLAAKPLMTNHMGSKLNEPILTKYFQGGSGIQSSTAARCALNTRHYSPPSAERSHWKPRTCLLLNMCVISFCSKQRGQRGVPAWRSLHVSARHCSHPVARTFSYAAQHQLCKTIYLICYTTLLLLDVITRLWRQKTGSRPARGRVPPPVTNPANNLQTRPCKLFSIVEQAQAVLKTAWRQLASSKPGVRIRASGQLLTALHARLLRRCDRGP